MSIWYCPIPLEFCCLGRLDERCWSVGWNRWICGYSCKGFPAKGGVPVIVPVETIAGLLGGVCATDFGGEDAIAWSSGLLDMMADARLISDGGGADAGLLTDPGGGERSCLSAPPTTGLTRL